MTWKAVSATPNLRAADAECEQSSVVPHGEPSGAGFDRDGSGGAGRQVQAQVGAVEADPRIRPRRRYQSINHPNMVKPPINLPHTRNIYHTYFKVP